MFKNCGLDDLATNWVAESSITIDPANPSTAAYCTLVDDDSTQNEMIFAACGDLKWIDPWCYVLIKIDILKMDLWHYFK